MCLHYSVDPTTNDSDYGILKTWTFSSQKYTFIQEFKESKAVRDFPPWGAIPPIVNIS